MPSTEEMKKALKRSIKKSPNVTDDSSAFAIMKDQGFLRQGKRGRKETVLTPKGKKAARNAIKGKK